MARDPEGGAGRRQVNASAFVLPDDVRRAIADHAIRDRPLECCGLLVGRDRTVIAAVPMRNVAASSTRFRIDDREHIGLRRALRLISPPAHVIGVYHSHPMGPARPSPTDLADAHYPDWLYVIAGFVDSRVRVRGFMLEAGRMWPVRLSTGTDPRVITEGATMAGSSSRARRG
jgi:proteasome lid subunit RPN8/RPN11